jgi:adenine-specific DNA-methyltransferase
LSYNNEGLMSHETIETILGNYGIVDIYSTDYSRFRADKEANRNHKANYTQEFLFCLRKK